MTNEASSYTNTVVSMSLFRALTENSTEIIITQNAEGKITFVSAPIYKITGYQEHKVIGHALYEFLADGDAQAVAAQLVAVLANPGTSVVLDFRFVHANGDVLFLEGTAVNMFGTEGVACVIFNLRDTTQQKLTDEKLLVSELKLRSLIENSHDGIALMSVEGKMIYLSSAIERIMGYSLPELLGTDPRLLSHPDDLAPVAKILEALYPRFGLTATAEYRMRHKNGEWLWIKSNITNLLHEEHIAAFVFNYEDITERKKAEALLVQSERMMANAQKIAHFGSWELDITDGYGYGELRWSEEVFRIFGYTPGSIHISIEQFFASVYPEDRTLVSAATEEALLKNAHYCTDHRIVWPDGSIGWVREDAHYIKDSTADKKNRLIGTVRDITDQKDAEDKLLKSEANMKAIFDHTEIAYTMLDKNLNIVTFNPRAERWISIVYKEKLYAGTSYLSYIKNNPEAGRLTILLMRVLKGENILFDYHSTLSGGHEIWNLIRMNPIIGADEKVYGICIAISDITLRKQHEIERERITMDLIQRNKDLEQFTYVVSHNLRAPLTNIMGLSQLLYEDGQDEDFRKTYTKQLGVSVQKMDTIIKDLNHVLQVKKEVSEVKRTVYFSELVNDIKLSIENIMQQQNVEVLMDFTAVDEFLTIKSYLYSIFYNLITNSIKYRQPSRRPIIDIKSRLSAKKLEIVFKDNGLGIDLKRKGKEVFGLYKRFHHHIEGKGMGLFMVKTQAETIGGTISVESEVNKGTTFIISFPIK